MSHSDQRRRRVLRAAAPVAGLLAAGLLVWQGSNAAFTAQTNNTQDSWATGTLTLTNDAGTGTYAATTAALFTETTLKPGTTVAKCLTVQAGGTTGGTLKFYRGAITGSNSAALAPQLALTITAMSPSTTSPGVSATCTGFVPAGATTVAPGTALSAVPTTYAGGLGSIVVPAGTRFVAYRISYTFTPTGTNAGDNALQSSDAAADLSWEIQ